MTFKYEEVDMEYERRVEANDPVAMRQLGIRHFERGDYKSAFEYWTKGAELGDAASHHELSVMYNRGEGVEKDLKKEARHLKEAAIAGNPSSRHNLGCAEWENGRKDRAVKHWIIAANLGYDKSMMSLMSAYSLGSVSKEDFESALRAHQAAVDATKSPQREAAAEIDRMRR
jgi:TPR repeat protein